MYCYNYCFRLITLPTLLDQSKDFPSVYSVAFTWYVSYNIKCGFIAPINVSLVVGLSPGAQNTPMTMPFGHDVLVCHIPLLAQGVGLYWGLSGDIEHHSFNKYILIQY